MQDFPSAFIPDRNLRKVGDTINAIVEPASADVEYAWAIADSATAAESEWTPILGATNNYFTVSESAIGKFIKVTVTDEDGNEDFAVTTAPVTKDGSSEVVLTDDYGLQSDGTGIITDRLRISFGADFGIPRAITWYHDGVVLDTATSETGVARLLTHRVTAAEGTGTYYAVVIDDEGVNHTTNEIVISKTEDPAELLSFTIEDDYTDGTDVDYQPEDNFAVATMTLNKNFQGTFSIYKATDTKFANAVDTLNTAANTPADAAATVASAGAGDSVLTADAGTNYNVLQKTAGSGLGYIAPDGTVTYKFAVAAGLTRGKDYVVVFDQQSDTTDDIGGGSENVFEDAVTAPYVTAPTKAEITKATKNAPIEITFYTGDDTVMNFAGKTTALAGIDAIGATTSSAIYSATTANAATTAATKKTTAIANAASVKQGVWTTANAVDDNNAFWFANIEFGKGIYGADKLTLRTADADLAQDAADSVKIKYSSGSPKDFGVEFSNLRTDGTLYLVALNDSDGTGEATTDPTVSDETAAAGFARLYADQTVAIASVDVEKGADKATFTDAISGLTMGDGETTGSAKAGNSYIAVFLPTDDEHYSPVYTAAKADVTATLTSYKLVGKKEFTTGASYADTAEFDPDTDTAIVALDQFGKDMPSATVEATTAVAMTCATPTLAFDTTAAVTFVTAPSALDEDGDSAVDYPTYSIITLADDKAKVNKNEAWTLALSTGQTVKIVSKGDGTAASATAVATASTVWSISLS